MVEMNLVMEKANLMMVNDVSGDGKGESGESKSESGEGKGEYSDSNSVSHNI